MTEEEMLKEIEKMRGDVNGDPNTGRVGAEDFKQEDGYLFEVND